MTQDIKNETTEEKAVEKAKTIEVSEKDFLALVAEVKAIRDGNTIKKPEKVVEGQRTADIRVYEDMPVVDIRNFSSKEMQGAAGKETKQFAHIICDEGDNKEKDFGSKDYLDFLNNTDQAKVRLIRVNKVIDKSISHGVFDSQNPNPVEKKSFMSSPVELKVEMSEKLFDIEIMDGKLKGKKFIINEKALNM